MRDFHGPMGREESLKKRSNRKRHRPEEVVAKLRQADEALAKGTPIVEVARSPGVSEVTLHRWRAECGAMDRDAVRRMKELEKENARLKHPVADQQTVHEFLPEDVEFISTDPLAGGPVCQQSGPERSGHRLEHTA